MPHPVPPPPYHAHVTFWLDVVDKAIKFAAVCLGGVWTYWNYRKSRPYAQKLDIQMDGQVFRRSGLCVEIGLQLKNVGSAKFPFQQQGTACELSAILDDGSIRNLRTFAIFTNQDRIEPGETITDRMIFRLPASFPEVVWFRVDLVVMSGGTKWYEPCLIRVHGLPYGRRHQL